MVFHCPQFTSIWIVVVSVLAEPGEQLEPLALVAKEIETGNRIEVDAPKLRRSKHPPYPTGPQSLLVTSDANHLIGCHLALGWRVPERIVDLSIEFRNSINGLRVPCGTELLGALIWFGLPTAGAFSLGLSPEAQRRRIDATARLFDAMRPTLDWGCALLRGRYLTAVAHIESMGVPVDDRVIHRLANGWPEIKHRLVGAINELFGVCDGDRFRVDAFESWLCRRGIIWPRTSAGRLDLGNNAFRDMARIHPDVRILKELRTTLSDFDPRSLTIGGDGRNRTPLRPFASRTGRNQPSAKAAIFGSAACIRHLVRPQPGMGLALIDWCQQEFGIAAALSEDAAMQAAYLTGDPYLALAVAAGAAPTTASGAAHSSIRDRFKACALGVQYGMGPATLARLLAQPEAVAQKLIRQHRAAFPIFWRWSDAIEAHALLNGELQSVFGWRIAVGPEANPRFLRNFPMQANGAEMLRLACCLATENGIRVCTTLHDALLIEAPLGELNDAVGASQRLMAEASRVVLDGFELRTDSVIVRHPDRYQDPRGAAVWQALETVLADGKTRQANSGPRKSLPVRQRNKTCSSRNTRSISLYDSKEDSSDASD